MLIISLQQLPQNPIVIITIRYIELYLHVFNRKRRMNHSKKPDYINIPLLKLAAICMLISKRNIHHPAFYYFFIIKNILYSFTETD